MTAIPAIYDEKFTRGLYISGEKKPNPLRLADSVLGITFPFHPTLWGDNLLNETLAGVKELVHALLKEKHSTMGCRKMLIQVDNIFQKLDFNTHRKSVAIVVSPKEEKIIYLDFPVKAAVIIGKEISLFDLITNIEIKEAFFLLILETDRQRLFEYNGNKLNKVFEQSGEEDSANLYKKTYQAIELLNSKNEKPVFVTGQPNLVELFCINPSPTKTMFMFLYEYHSFSTKTLDSYVIEITRHWNYWHTNFITDKILTAQKTDSLITAIEPITAVLNKKADGLLMIDKWFSKRLTDVKRANGNSKI